MAFPYDQSPSFTSCRALVWVDSSRLKSEEQVKCQKIYKKLENTRKSIELHESRSIPEFQKWLNLHFGQQLTQLRELGQKLMELESTIQTVNEQSFFTGIPPWKVYAELQRQRENAESRRSTGRSTEEGSQDSGDFRDAHDSDGPHCGGNSAEDLGFEEQFMDEFARSAFESLFGTQKQWRSKRQSYEEAFQQFKTEMFEEMSGKFEEDEEDFDPRQNSGRGNNSQRNNPFAETECLQTENAKSDLARIKEQYRILARKLHPDLNPGLDPKSLELWHQVQAAYEARDLARLVTLSAMSEMFDQKWERIDGISTLRRLYDELKIALKQLEKKIRLARKDKSWKFHEKIQDLDKMAKFQREITRELQEQEQELQIHLEEFQSLIQSWEKSLKRKRKHRS